MIVLGYLISYAFELASVAFSFYMAWQCWNNPEIPKTGRLIWILGMLVPSAAVLSFLTAELLPFSLNYAAVLSYAFIYWDKKNLKIALLLICLLLARAEWNRLYYKFSEYRATAMSEMDQTFFDNKMEFYTKEKFRERIKSYTYGTALELATDIEDQEIRKTLKAQITALAERDLERFKISGENKYIVIPTYLIMILKTEFDENSYREWLNFYHNYETLEKTELEKIFIRTKKFWEENPPQEDSWY